MLSRQRYVIVGILALALIAAMPLAHGFQWAWVQLGWDDPPILSRELSLTTLIAYALGVAAATFALKHRPTFQLATEVVDELTKVTWPSREETGNATVVVIMTVIICSVFLGVFDFLWLSLTDWILGVRQALPGGA